VRVLIACEFSGTVRDAFRAQGHDAWSCDILPTEKPGPHILNDVRNVLDWDWDLMIAHPPCTYLTTAGNRWMKPEYAHLYPNRQQDRKNAIDFVKLLWDAQINHIVIENPVGVLSTTWRKPDQIIHPWHFGTPEKKATCLWLKNMPLLRPTTYIKPSFAVRPDGSEFVDGRGFRSSQTHYDSWYLPPAERAKARSRTYQCIADAMAKQWGGATLTVQQALPVLAVA
jgi:hypothetical protein